MNQNDVKSWIDSASAQDLISTGKLVLTRIATLPPEHRDRFFDEVKRDPTVSRLFETTQA